MKEFQMPALTKYIIDLKNEKHPETNIFEMCDINEAKKMLAMIDIQADTCTKEEHDPESQIHQFEFLTADNKEDIIKLSLFYNGNIQILMNEECVFQLIFLSLIHI